MHPHKKGLRSSHQPHRSDEAGARANGDRYQSGANCHASESVGRRTKRGTDAEFAATEFRQIGNYAEDTADAETHRNEAEGRKEPRAQTFSAQISGDQIAAGHDAGSR